MDRLARSQRLLRALTAAFGARVGAPVDVRETHISWVLLAGGDALKLKKPVRLPFADFSTPQRRRHFCEEELRLNRRLAPSLYRAVLAVRGSVDAPVLPSFDVPDDACDLARVDAGADPPDDAIDHLVLMRRFADGALLGERLAAGTLVPAQLDRLAGRLADFHRDAAVAVPPSPFGAPALVLGQLAQVLAQLEALAPVPALRGWIDAQSPRVGGLLEARRRAGAVRECHGDLHLANALVLPDGDVTAFDCLEFDPALRWIDVIGDVAFLSMDLAAHGRPDLAGVFIDAYLQRTGDFEALPVLRFFEFCRALVRALTQRLATHGAAAAAGAAAALAPDYLGHALGLAARGGGQGAIVLMHGLSGSGKSTVARLLAAETGAVRLCADVERKRLFGLAPLARSAGTGLDLYSTQASQRTFDRLADAARAVAGAGFTAIIDATFLRRVHRERFRALAAAIAAPFAIVHCHAGQALLQSRVAARAAGAQDPSEADAAVLAAQVEAMEALDAHERRDAIDVDTSGPLDAVALAALWRRGR